MREILKNNLVWIAALGYAVDLFDLVLYGVVRVSSLKAIHVADADIFRVGTMLLNYQMAGMLVGGFVWGAIGDKIGRRGALFGSILLYSLATFGNAFVTDVNSYAVLRFLAGFGLAGELGAALTLVTESLPQATRGLGAALITAVGYSGAALSSYLTQKIEWQHAYELGGILGMFLLIARLNIQESAVFLASKKSKSENKWGSWKQILFNRRRFGIFFCGLIVGIPIWYVAGILSYFAPEIASGFRITGVTAGTTIMVGYIGALFGNVTCAFLSQYLKSRKKALITFLCMSATAVIASTFILYDKNSTWYYATRMLIGFGNGFFIILLTWMAEAFGTNLRSTVTTNVSNIVRASVIPLTLVFEALRPSFGFVNGSLYIGVVCFAAALIAALFIPETFHRELDYLEN